MMQNIVSQTCVFKKTNIFHHKYKSLILYNCISIIIFQNKIYIYLLSLPFCRYIQNKKN